jgi:hypothetical protein
MPQCYSLYELYISPTVVHFFLNIFAFLYDGLVERITK